MAESDQWKESDVVLRFGVPKDELVSFRKSEMQEGRHWERVPSGKRPLRTCPIAYTEEGWKMVYERFGLLEVNALLEPDGSSKVIVMKPADAPKETFSKAEVVRCDYPNRRVMLIRLEDGKTAFCTVFDSTPFKPKLPIVVKHRGGRWYCEHRPTSILRLNALLKRNESDAV
jgi:hypothetical protein